MTAADLIIYELGSTEVKVKTRVSINTPQLFVVDSVELWSPDSPILYNISVTLGDDTVTSYTGFRTISKGEVNGIQRPLLNGQFVFMFGTLDQGYVEFILQSTKCSDIVSRYWPDGLHTPPSLEAMVYDLKALKEVGYNMVRKHVSGQIQLIDSNN